MKRNKTAGKVYKFANLSTDFNQSKRTIGVVNKLYCYCSLCSVVFNTEASLTTGKSLPRSCFHDIFISFLLSDFLGMTQGEAFSL